jgi:tetratricopeptide (TPR) repeat protein
MLYLQCLLRTSYRDLLEYAQRKTEEEYLSFAFGLLQEDWEVPGDWADCTFLVIQLEECIDRFPKYYEAYIYRGKLYLKLKEFKYALQDFDKAILIDHNKQIAYVGKGDCLRLIERYE